MWLIDTHTFELHWCHNPEQENYAILSYVWDRKGEQNFQASVTSNASMQAPTGKPRLCRRAPSPPATSTTPMRQNERFSAKLRSFCEIARSHGCRYVWIDACCIDKTSSAELSEAINSMFEWYSRAEVCFVFLHDVGATEDPYAPDSAFRRSEWFRRDWTLQELIAPSEVVFLFACVIEEITNIEAAILSHAKELSSTTRVEDEAYSLMGLFGIYMPTIYGEGRNAFLRLQEEILRRIPDQSIFAWGTCINMEDSSTTLRG
ncbi:HET-domain-containing protein [Lentinus tigrinus ALCF2SS1-7]|uniref:HET-domain-containing protein n=1 Tax=Lentinus tigrinus ALCF2SS1-7 TaxID=1328758 RepID=UPI001165F504|nr:HET-domain-containing protein [Lentinus tigrinus ALCF2SS1-7]